MRRYAAPAWSRGMMVACAVGVLPASAGANCMNQFMNIAGEANRQVFFPNWQKAYAAAFAADDWAVSCGAGACGAPPNCGAGASCGLAAVQVNSLTIVNFGTATNGLAGSGWDIAAVYWRTDADAAGTYHTMTAASPNMWTWKWNGAEANPDFSLTPALRIYVDMSSTPMDGKTVQMGIPYDTVTWMGGFVDMCCCDTAGAWSDLINPYPKFVYHVFKVADLKTAAPGDLINYTIYYSRPGTGNITNLEILDTQPPYTHYVPGSASPAPDSGWDPDPGPPLRLKWTIPGPLATTGGPTGAITFQLSVDWGINPFIDPQGGDVGAPEGANLWNQAVGTFPNLAAGNRVHQSNQTKTVIMRYLFWELADRDVLFNSTVTLNDEATYSIFIKNMSATKTWWEVHIWDTVPPELNPWLPGYGFDDPCSGWTMTPSGCAAAAPGRIVVGGKTIMTWKLDMPPKMTLTVQWRAQVTAAAMAGATAINRVSVLEYGNSNIAGGTGHATIPRNFTHLANVVLRTSYVSYVSYDVMGTFGCGGYYALYFYPLHPSCAWQLYKLDGACGLNASITTPAPTSGLSPCNVWPGLGCPVGAERRPQRYGDSGMTGCATGQSYYKVVSNAPILWEVNPQIAATDEDSMMYSTATTLSFRGYMIYTWRRSMNGTSGPDDGDYLGIANTENVATTVHMFWWDAGSSSWSYVKTRQIEPNCQWITGGTPVSIEGHWRIISSDSNLIVWKGYCFGASDVDNYVTMAPAAPSGNLTARGGETFYAYDGPRMGGNAHAGTIMVITNIGAVLASYAVEQYVSDDPFDTEGASPANMGGSSGNWFGVDSGTIPAGAAAVANPKIYGRLACMDITTGFTNSWELFKVKIVNGGPIQVKAGRGGLGRYAGYIMHGLDEFGNPAQTAHEFWHTQVGEDNNNDVTAFLPAKGMAVECTADGVLVAAYVSTGPDQPVSWCGVNDPAGVRLVNCGTNYRVRVTAPANGRVIGMANGNYFTERHYAAPFLAAGTHYDIQAPAVVFTGQSFWITIVVTSTMGGTKVDYCGTTSFTSTDPTAKIEGSAMDGFNFTWSSSTACSSAPNEDGVHVFINITLNRIGIQTIVGNDIYDGSITGLIAIQVTGADVKIFKAPKLTVAASGDTVQFKVCWSNYSSASAFSMVLTDAVPAGTAFLPEASAAAFDCGTTDGVAVTTAYSTATTGTMPAAGSFTTGLPVSLTRWLRWTVPMAGVQTTGCACFRVQVD